MTILTVEDDQALGKALERGLRGLGHECLWVKSGAAAIQQAVSRKFDVIILDRMLPETEGLEVLRRIRQLGVRTPVMFLTALGGLDDRIHGLNTGADDYLVKPFEFAELVARLHAVCRRSVPIESSVLVVGKLTLDLSTRRVTREGRELDLTPTEFSFLEFLMRHAGHVVTRKMLCEHLWESDWEGMTNVIEVHVSRLRNKIDRGFQDSLLHTIRGCGYVLRAVEA